MKSLPDALDTIDAALKAVAHWNPDNPDEERRAAMYAALLAGFRAAPDLSAPEGTTSPGARPRRELLEGRRFAARILELAALNEPLDDDWVTVARAAAWLGRAAVSAMREDFLADRNKRQQSIVAGKLSSGEDVQEDHRDWIEYAIERVAKAPGVGPKEIAREIYAHQDRKHGDKRDLKTIENYLVKHRVEWDPERQ